MILHLLLIRAVQEQRQQITMMVFACTKFRMERHMEATSLWRQQRDARLIRWKSRQQINIIQQQWHIVLMTMRLCWVLLMSLN